MTTTIRGFSKKQALENVIVFHKANISLKFRATKLYEHNGIYFVEIEW